MSPTTLPSQHPWIQGSSMTDGGMVDNYRCITTAMNLVRKLHQIMRNIQEKLFCWNRIS